jgi:hypothetical protein
MVGRIRGGDDYLAGVVHLDKLTSKRVDKSKHRRVAQMVGSSQLDERKDLTGMVCRCVNELKAIPSVGICGELPKDLKAGGEKHAAEDLVEGSEKVTDHVLDRIDLDPLATCPGGKCGACRESSKTVLDTLSVFLGGTGLAGGSLVTGSEQVCYLFEAFVYLSEKVGRVPEPG